MTTPADDDHFLRHAVGLARRNMLAGAGGPFGAVVVKDGVIVGEGWNQVTSTNDPTAHAEVQAIRDAGRRLGTFNLAGAVLYASCEPCPMCLAATYWSRVDRLVYGASAQDAAAAGFDDAFLHDQLRMPPGERSLPVTNRLPEESAAVFADWMAKEDRIPY